MNSVVSLPLWLVALLSLAAIVSLNSHLLKPLLRWWLRDREQRFNEQLKHELTRKLPEIFNLPRKTRIDLFLNKPEVKAAIAKEVQANRGTQGIIEARARTYISELTPEFYALFYFKFGYYIARMYLRFMYWVHIGQQPSQQIANIPADSSVVVVGNHRSNIDVMVLAYLAAHTNMISFAAGEWANVWPMSAMLHMSGSYIVRRDTSDPLYRSLLAIHVQELIRVKMPQGIFPEGNLTRDGRMRPFKLGLLNYMLASLNTENIKDIVFVPVAFNYDQTPEDRTLIKHEKHGFNKKSRFYSLISTSTYLLRFAVQKIQRGKAAYGNAAVNFGEPLSMKQWLLDQNIELESLNDEQRHAMVSPVGDLLFQRISRLIPVLPVSVVASAIVLSGKAQFSVDSIHDLCKKTLLQFEMNNAVVIRDEQQTISDFIHDGLDVLLIRQVVENNNGAYKVREDRRALLQYIYNTTAHLLAEHSMQNQSKNTGD